MLQFMRKLNRPMSIFMAVAVGAFSLFGVVETFQSLFAATPTP